ncbi:hypothetical protein RND71_028553 [Anisodus tanguticus]|uniref:Uncharacterized protein n=1 Tax=Anisodus tanguticus TaxID=243964 RepID=A0AAE1VA53_9SOLA|nr:hypothetical protein RND71_028553 [Anisodus tanguticus]
MGDALVQWKRSEFVYNKTLGLLKIINFSSNELAGSIPEEIAQLDGVLSLNLSRNNLTGNIIEGIGKMEKLESLDLSDNQLTGRIPTSLAQLNFLSVLDLSSNNLLGKIPSSTQLQSFDPSSYAGNNEHCGSPFAECPIADHSRINNLDEDDKILSFGFYVCVASGFIPQATNDVKLSIDSQLYVSKIRILDHLNDYAIQSTMFKEVERLKDQHELPLCGDLKFDARE